MIRKPLIDLLLGQRQSRGYLLSLLNSRVHILIEFSFQGQNLLWGERRLISYAEKVQHIPLVRKLAEWKKSTDDASTNGSKWRKRRRNWFNNQVSWTRSGWNPIWTLPHIKIGWDVLGIWYYLDLFKRKREAANHWLTCFMDNDNCCAMTRLCSIVGYIFCWKCSLRAAACSVENERIPNILRRCALSAN